MKIVVIVEGQTEKLFVIDLLQKINSNCVNIIAIDLYYTNHKRIEIKNSNSTTFYQILDVENDKKVLDTILENEQRFYEKGFEKIIALRDIYSAEYRMQTNFIDSAIINKFIDGVDNSLNDKAKCRSKIFFHFAIMELEAWFLGMGHIFEKLNSILTIEKIKDEIYYDLKIVNPEDIFVQPSKIIGKILGIIGQKYSKHFIDIKKILKNISEDDYWGLQKEGKCKSYKQFFLDISNLS